MIGQQILLIHEVGALSMLNAIFKVILFKQLKRRLRNLRKVKKPQGPCQDKKRKSEVKDSQSTSLEERPSTSIASTKAIKSADPTMESDSGRNINWSIVWLPS